METKNQLSTLYLQTRVYLKLFLYKLGIIHPETYSREYIVRLYRQLKEASEREGFIIQELMNLSSELVDKGYLTPKQLLQIKYMELLITTFCIFNKISFSRDSLDQLLTASLHDEEFQLWESFITEIIKPEDTLNEIIKFIKHLKKITTSPVDEFSKTEIKELKKEINSIISYSPLHILFIEKMKIRCNAKALRK